MAKLIRTKVAPKGGGHRMEINLTSTGLDLEEVLEWCREQLSQTVYWDLMGIAPAKKVGLGVAPSRKKHFDDEEQMLVVWFSRKRDAAMFKITWFWRSK